MRAEVLVVGGGLAGSAAAISLARGGRDVALVEREARPVHKVCGEFLSMEALAYLRALGVDPVALEAVEISAVRLAGGTGMSENRLPFPALSLTRRRLDEELLLLAVEAGVRVVRGRTVEGVEAASGGWRVRLGEGERATATARSRFPSGMTERNANANANANASASASASANANASASASASANASATAKANAEDAEGTRRNAEEGGGTEAEIGMEVNIEAGAVFLATGKHDVRGRARPAGRQNDLVAFKMYWRLAPAQTAAMQGYVDLIMYRGGYGGLQLVEDGAANLCCLIERDELRRLGGRWEKLLAQSPHLRERLEGAEALLERPLAVSAIPYGMVREHADGVWHLGDQAAVVPSFTGDGMAIALHTGMLAAQMYLAGETAQSFQRRVHGELSRQVGLATWLSRGLVNRPGLMGVTARIWPGALRVVATRTRIPAGRMLA